MEKGERECVKSLVSSFLDLKTSLWPGLQRPAALAELESELLPDINSMFVDFTSVRWKYPGQQRHCGTQKNAKNSAFDRKQRI